MVAKGVVVLILVGCVATVLSQIDNLAYRQMFHPRYQRQMAMQNGFNNRPNVRRFHPLNRRRPSARANPLYDMDFTDALLFLLRQRLFGSFGNFPSYPMSGPMSGPSYPMFSPYRPAYDPFDVDGPDTPDPPARPARQQKGRRGGRRRRPRPRSRSQS